MFQTQKRINFKRQRPINKKMNTDSVSLNLFQNNCQQNSENSKTNIFTVNKRIYQDNFRLNLLKNNYLSQPLQLCIAVLIFCYFLTVSQSSCIPNIINERLNISQNQYCTVKFNSCSSWSMQSCIYYDCDTNDNTKCQVYWITTSQSVCFSRCCTNYKNDVNKYNTFSKQMCKGGFSSQANQPDISSNGGFIFMGVLAGVIILGFVIFCCYKCRKNREDDTYDIQHQENPHLAPTNYPSTAVDLSKFSLEGQGPYFINEQTCCAICLENKVNLRTHCNHFFHGQCLMAWIRKKPNNPCPLCIQIQYNPVKVYCVNCHVGDKLINFEAGMEDLLVKQFQINKCQICRRVISQTFSIIDDLDEVIKVQNKAIQVKNNNVNDNVNYNILSHDWNKNQLSHYHQSSSFRKNKQQRIIYKKRDFNKQTNNIGSLRLNLNQNQNQNQGQNQFQLAGKKIQSLENDNISKRYSLPKNKEISKRQRQDLNQSQKRLRNYENNFGGISRDI